MSREATSTHRVLLIGKGAREHSLAWKLSHSPSVQHVYVTPGNGGTTTLDKVSNITSVAENDYHGLVRLARELEISFVVAGPDDVIVDGIQDYFADSGIPCFAPSKAAAEIECSKSFSKSFMKRNQIPTADYQHFDDYNTAKTYLDRTASGRVVIKVDGLAAGKGVVLPNSQSEAHEALREIMLESRFGDAGKSVVIEEHLEGDEISVLTFADGDTFKSLPVGQDHKRIHDGNQGPNTGGMGVYAPLPFVTAQQIEYIEQKIIRPTLDGLRSEGREFIGMLFTEIMLTDSGLKVLEYNARFGDPETQTMVMLLAPEFDLASVLLACCTRQLHMVKLPILPGYACNVVVASAGYPGSYMKGCPIQLGTCPEGAQIFHAGTMRDREDKLRTNGGRVFSVAAYGTTLQEAVSLAYQATQAIHFEGKTYRTDIGSRAL